MNRYLHLHDESILLNLNDLEVEADLCRAQFRHRKTVQSAIKVTCVVSEALKSRLNLIVRTKPRKMRCSRWTGMCLSPTHLVVDSFMDAIMHPQP